MRCQMRDAAAGERSWPGSTSDASERSGRDMARPKTMLIVCLIMVANSHVDKERSFPGKGPRDNQETPLHHAAKRAAAKCAEVLLRNGAELKENGDSKLGSTQQQKIC